MGINHSSNHKRKHTGGRKRLHCKKRNYAKGRSPSNTKLTTHTTVQQKVSATNVDAQTQQNVKTSRKSNTFIKNIRVRGGNIKRRAIRIREGNFSIKPFNTSFRSNIKSVVYHPSNHELVRMNIITKSVIVKVDEEKFKKSLQNLKNSESSYDDIMKTIKEKDSLFYENLNKGNVYARVTSRPGQVGTVDGYVLHADELKFYEEKINKKKVKGGKNKVTANDEMILA